MKTKTKREEGFLQLSNKLLDDKNYTLAEKGLIAVILSNKEDGQDDFKLNIEEIYRRSKGTDESQRRVFKMLQEKGLIKQSMSGCKKTGKINWKYERTGIEAYLANKEPSTGKQSTVLPDTGNTKLETPITENHSLNNTTVNNTNPNNINQTIKKEEEKEKASKLNEPKLVELKSKSLVDEQMVTVEEHEACWPVFFEVEREEEFDPKDHLPSDDHSILEAPVFDEFPYEAHMANEQEERFKSFIQKDSETEYSSNQSPIESSIESSNSKKQNLQINEETNSTAEISISTINGKSDLSLKEKTVVFDLLKELFLKRSDEFSSVQVMAKSLKAYAHKLNNADFMPGGKVVNNWNSYLTAAIQGVINDLNVVEREKEEERLNKQIRNMKAQGYDYVDGKFVEATKFPGLKYGGS